ncbi:zinc ribbon domain-containing protein [Haloarcula sp. S1AR25-5A]|uniref:Zinc ribbon domain-containing protein n=1 Tax=Haloarcula terrestris TaxID=2950533 RepID=A0AAE4EVG2_9EURY|nr:zinc ribbon domain-containing protein [Haloarcula terrestris]MDS0220871.1 zinc ribbon domain-containing protein [Haloarcula terrestris]
MTNEELLRVVASLDAEKYPIATHARNALGIPAEKQPDTPDFYTNDSQGQASYCPQCGDGVDADDQFCRHCGHELPED